MSGGLQLDPALRELMLRRAVDPLANLAAEEINSDEVPVVAKLVDPSAPVAQLRVVARFGRVVTGRLPLKRIAAVRRHPNIISLKASRGYGPDLAFSVLEIRASSSALRQEVLPEGITGRGVILGFADWGLDVAHVNFLNQFGNTRLLFLWDQRGGLQPESPPDFGYGRELNREQINAALVQPDAYAALDYDPLDSDLNGTGAHGTHVADIAAGNGSAPGSSPGVAPEADLIFVHLAASDTLPQDSLGDSVRLLEAVRYIVDRAGERPLVINLSLGRHGGQHDGTTLVEQALDYLLEERRGTAIVFSTGNYFDADIHSSGQIKTGGSVDLKWQTAPRNDEIAEMEVWYSGLDLFSVELIDPDGTSLGRVSLGDHRVIRNEGGHIIASIYHRRKDPNNGDNQIDIFLWPEAMIGTWRTKLHGEVVKDGRYHAWIERDDAQRQSRFTPDCATRTTTTGTICNGHLTIAVGAYDARRPSRQLVPFSSAGRTRDGRQKPDISAPGAGIRAARSSFFRNGHREVNGTTIKSGSSMAAPHVSGTIALMFEAAGQRRLSARETRAILLKTARGSPPYNESDRLRYGAGRLDAAAAVGSARELGQSAASNGALLAKSTRVRFGAKESRKRDYILATKKEAGSVYPDWAGPSGRKKDMNSRVRISDPSGEGALKWLRESGSDLLLPENFEPVYNSGRVFEWVTGERSETRPGSSAENYIYEMFGLAESTEDSDQSPFFASTNALFGIDVSAYQTTSILSKGKKSLVQIKWDDVRGSGVEFAFARATLGTGDERVTVKGEIRAPSQFAYNWGEMEKAGIVRGAYHFLKAADNAEEQANNFVKTIIDNGGLTESDLPPVVDVEWDNVKRKLWAKDGTVRIVEKDVWDDISDRATVIAKWLLVVEKKLKRKPIIYTSAGWWAGWPESVEVELKDEPGKKYRVRFAAYPLWIADVNHDPSKSERPFLPYRFVTSNVGGETKTRRVAHPWTGWTFWQYKITPKGGMKGIDTSVDLDIFNKAALGDLQTWIRGTIFSSDADIDAFHGLYANPKLSAGGKESTPAAKTSVGNQVSSADPTGRQSEELTGSESAAKIGPTEGHFTKRDLEDPEMIHRLTTTLKPHELVSLIRNMHDPSLMEPLEKMLSLYPRQINPPAKGLRDGIVEGDSVRLTVNGTPIIFEPQRFLTTPLNLPGFGHVDADTHPRFDVNTTPRFDPASIKRYGVTKNLNDLIVADVPATPLAIRIRTDYGPGADPDAMVRYGRGITPGQPSTISLRIHEGFHAQDAIDYVRANAAPIFGGRVGMTHPQYDTEVVRYYAALQVYQRAITDYSIRVTDCTGNPMPIPACTR